MCMYLHIYIYTHMCNTLSNTSNQCYYNLYMVEHMLRPFVIQIIVRPKIFESKLCNHCAKKLDGALRKPTSFV